MRLTPMTDFVLQFEQNEAKSPELRNFLKGVDTVVNYAKFLKQPLTLGMFVPCDENGNVLQEPELCNEFFSVDEEEVYEHELYLFETAEEKVLFKGFVLIGNTVDNINGNCFFTEYLRGRNVEDLIHMNLTLTESAIKQIGL